MGWVQPDAAFEAGWDAALALAGTLAAGLTPPPPCETPVANDSPSWLTCWDCERIAVPGFDYCSAHLTPGACDG